MSTDTKRVFGSKSRRLRDKQEFLDKIKLKEDTDYIYLKCNDKRKEIEIQKNEIADVFIKSNTCEELLRKYVMLINAKIYDTSVEIDNRIEKLAKEILSQIEEIQIKIQKVIKYTKLEMEKEIEERFNEAERRQQEKMIQKVNEQNQMINNMNHTRYELDLIKIQFEETNIQCNKLNKINEQLKIDLDTVKSDNINLKKKLNEVEQSNAQIKEEYFTLFNNNNNNNNNNIINDNIIESLSNNDSNKSVSDNNADNNNNNSITSNSQNDPYNPKLLIVTLKDVIKLSRKEINDLTEQIADMKKEKNEASQLLQKCIDDINIEYHNTIGNSNSNYTTYGNKKYSNIPPTYYGATFDVISNNSSNSNFSIKTFQNPKLKALEHRLEVLTYIYDNSLQNVKHKKMYFGSQPNAAIVNTTGMSKRTTFYK
jgi:hypothetical protein